MALLNTHRKSLVHSKRRRGSHHHNIGYHVHNLCTFCFGGHQRDAASSLSERSAICILDCCSAQLSAAKLAPPSLVQLVSDIDQVVHPAGSGFVGYQCD